MKWKQTHVYTNKDGEVGVDMDTNTFPDGVLG